MPELTPDQKKRLEVELTKYATEGASDNDMRLFRDELVKQYSGGSNGVEKKSPFGNASEFSWNGLPASQKTTPSPSNGQLKSGERKDEIDYSGIENVFSERKKASDNLRILKDNKKASVLRPTLYDQEDAGDFDKNIAEAATYDKQTEDAKNATLKAKKDLFIKPVEEAVSNGGYKNFLSDKGYFDYKKAIEFSDKYVGERGGGSFAKETMTQYLKQAVEAEKDRPRFTEILNEEYKKQGVDIDKTQQEVLDKMAEPKISLWNNIKAESQSKADELNNSTLTKAKEIGDNYTSSVNNLKQLFQSGQISEQDANAELDKLNSDYGNSVKQLDAERKSLLTEINNKVLSKYDRVKSELETLSKGVTWDKVFSSLPKEQQDKIKSAQQSASKRFEGEKQSIKRAEDATAMFSSGNPFLSLYGKAVASGWNQGLADIGEWLVFKGMDGGLAKSLRGKRTKAEELATAEYSWDKDWLARAITSSASSMGASLPIMIPSIAATLATGGVAGVALGGVLGFQGEKMQNAGGMWRQLIEEGKDPVDAAIKTEDFSKEQIKSLPAYFLGSLGIQKIVKKGLGNLLLGGGLEMTEEQIVEHFQGYSQDVASGKFKGEFGEWVKKHPDLKLDVIAGVIGQSSMMKVAAKSFESIFSKVPSPQTQFYTDMINNGGVEVALLNLKQQLDNDIITLEEFKIEKSKVDQVVSTLGKAKELGLKGDDAQAFIAYSSALNELTSMANNEQDPIIKLLYNKNISEAKQELTEIASGKGVYAVVTLPGGNNSKVVMPVENLTDTVIKNAEKVEVKNDKLANKDIQDKKKELGFPENAPEGMYKTTTPEAAPQSPSSSPKAEQEGVNTKEQVGSGGQAKVVSDNTWHRGVNKNNKEQGDRFYSADESTAHDYAINKVGDKPTMTKLSKEELPKNPLVVGTKEDLAETIGFPEENIYDLKGEFDKKAKEYAQSKGHDAIVYESGSMDNAEMHIFETTEQTTPSKPPKGEGAETKKITNENDTQIIDQEASTGTQPVSPEEKSQPEKLATEAGDGAKKPPAGGKEDVGEGKPQKGNKAILNRLYESKNIKDEAKKKFEEEGLNYETKSQDEARELAKGIVDEFGIEESVLLAEAGRFDGDVNTWIFGEALNRLQEQEASSKTLEQEFENGLQWAETSIRFDKYGRKLGRAVSAIYDFYKKSPIGIVLKENNNRDEIFKRWYKSKEKGFKELFEELQKDPDFKELFEKEVSERLKAERAEARKTRTKKVDDSIDSVIKKLKNGDIMFSSIVPPQVFVAALEGVKKAYHAGEVAVKIVQDAIDYVSKTIGTTDWDKDKFTDYVNDMVRDKGRKTLTDEEKKQRILDRFRKKLVGLNEKQKEEVVQRSMKKLLDAGALDYEDFKKIIAEVIGLQELTSEQVSQIKELQAKINNVQDAAKKARESRTGDLTDFRKAVKEGEFAQMKMDAILYQKAQPLTRFLDIVKLNTLGLVSLIKNVAYNIGWQPIRFGKSVFKTLLDYGIYGTSLLANKTFGSRIITPEDNVFLAQKGFFTGVGVGLSRAGLQFKTGLQDRDYYSRETFQGKIKPFQAWRDIWKWRKGELFLTNAQVADKLMQGTGGINAEFISRTLNIGDKWLKFGAERARAEQIARLKLGLNPNNKADFNLFIQFPKEEAYRIFKEKGLSDEEAMAKAEDVEKTIQLEGERSILQNDTWLNNMLSSLDKFINDKSESDDSVKSIAAGTAKVLKALSIPYVKIPINVGWNIINLTNPELALAQSALYGYGAIKASRKGEAVKSQSQARLSKDYLATAAVGMSLKLAATALVTLGLVRPRNDDEEKFKEKEGEKFYGRQNAFNWSGIKRLAIGGNPKPKEGDIWVDMSWLGVFGGLLNVHAGIAEEKLNKKSRGEEVDESYLDDIMGRLEGSVVEGFQNGVFSGTNNLINATKNGGGYIDNLFLNYMNMGINFFEPATYSQFSKAMQDEQTTYRADSLWQKIVNNQKQRDVIFRTFISKDKAPTRISIWGEPVKQGGVMQNMLGFSPDDRNKFGVLLWDDYQRTKDERFFPQPAPLSLTVDGKRVKLSAKEAEDLAIITGQNRKTVVSALVYNRANYGGKRYKGMTDDEKLEALSIVYEEANSAGFEEFKQRNPKYKNAKKNEYLEDIRKEKNTIFRKNIKGLIKKY